METRYEFDVGAVHYRASRLDVFDQWEVSQVLISVITSMPSMPIPKNKEDAKELTPEQLAAFGQAIATIPRAKFEAVTVICLANVERYQPEYKSWAKVWNLPVRRPQFDDLNNLSTLLPLLLTVIGENLGNFFGELPIGPVGKLTPTSSGPISQEASITS